MANIDDLLAGGGKSFKFDNPGDTITGTVTSVQVRQARDFDSGKPAVWDDGSPQEQIVVTLATNLRDDGDDDGERNVYIKGWGGQLRAFRAAVKNGGKPAAGDTFTATFTAWGPKPDRGFPPKEFTYAVVKATGGLDALVGAPVAAPVTPAAPPAPAVEKPADKVRQLIAVGLTDDQIAAATGLDAPVVAAIRAA